MIVVHPCQSDVLGNLKSGVVGIENFLVRDEYLRYGGRVADVLLEQLALETYYFRESAHLVLGGRIAAYAPVVYAAHAGGVHRIEALAFYNALLPILLYLLLVGHIVPVLVCSGAVTPASPFPFIVAKHLFAVARAEHDVVFLRHGKVGLVCPESLRAQVHGRPQRVGTQTKEQLHYLGVAVGTHILAVGIHVLGSPRLESPVLVVDEYAAVFHRRLTRHAASCRGIQLFLMRRNDVGPPDVRRYAHQTRHLEDGVSRATGCRTEQNQGAVNAFCGIIHGLKAVCLPFSLDVGNVNLAFGSEAVDEFGRTYGARNDWRTAGSKFCSDLDILACHGLDVACECRGSGLNDLSVVLVEYDGGGCSVVTNYREAARLLRVAHCYGVLRTGIACRQSRHSSNDDE